MNKKQLRELYCYRRLSMMEIAGELRITHATVLYWLKKHKIPRRSWSESTYVKRNPHGDPFAIPHILTTRQHNLLSAGLLLYWAEGAKTNRTGAKIGNLDGRLLQVFAMFLREVCHVDDRRLSVYVRVHGRFSRKAAQRYWSCLLKLPTKQVFVYPHTDTRSKAHHQWSKYGLATLEFHNTKFKAWLDQTIEHHINTLLMEQLDSETSRLIHGRHGGLAADGMVEFGGAFLTDEPHALISATQN